MKQPTVSLKKILILCFLYCTIRAATFTVINTNNSGPGSLLQAILDANTAGGNSTINFNIPGSPPQIIAPTTPYSSGAFDRVYPPFTNSNITLDATTQSGFALGSPSVIIDCAAIVDGGAARSSCFAIIGVNNCVIKGIGIENLVNAGSGRGISIENSASAGANGNQILQCRLGAFTLFGNTRAIVLNGAQASPTAAITNTLIDSNVLSGNSIAGFQAQFNVSGTIIQNNFIGCNYGGTVAVGNAQGVNFIGLAPNQACTNNTVQNNVISGNLETGVVLQAHCQNNVIKNNLIGTNGTGTTTLGSTTIGIQINGDNLSVDGANTLQSNVIGGCGNGIIITSNASNNTVTSNYVGTNSAGTNLGNKGSGIVIEGSADGPCLANLIQSNSIEFNGFLPAIGSYTISNDVEVPLIPPNGGQRMRVNDTYGIWLNGVAGNPDILNTMLANSDFDNAGNGIELDNNSNDNQQPPIILLAGVNQNQNTITIEATAPNSPAASTFRLEFFANTINRNPITEGAIFIGGINSVTTGQTVTQSFAISSPAIVPGNFVSATATNMNNAGNDGDTSEYSLNTVITSISPTIEPPSTIKVCGAKNIFLTQIDLINIITWQSPVTGSSPVLYRIYRDATLTDLAGTVVASSRLKFLDHNRQKKLYTYYIVSVDQLGNISLPISISIDRHCE